MAKMKYILNEIVIDVHSHMKIRAEFFVRFPLEI